MDYSTNTTTTSQAWRNCNIGASGAYTNEPMSLELIPNKNILKTPESAVFALSNISVNVKNAKIIRYIMNVPGVANSDERPHIATKYIPVHWQCQIIAQIEVMRYSKFEILIFVQYFTF